jgi:hypothetical protein
MLLKLTELFLFVVFTRQFFKFEKDYQIDVELPVFENILNQLGDKQTIVLSTLAKKHKVSFFIGLLAILK